MGTEDALPRGLKRLKHETDNLAPSTAEIKYVWSRISTYSAALIVCREKKKYF
jgi:hypothetical protein